MLQAGGSPDFRQKALASQHRPEVGVEDLDRHMALVPEVLRPKHRRHAAGAEMRIQDVAVGQRAGEHLEAGIVH